MIDVIDAIEMAENREGLKEEIYKCLEDSVTLDLFVEPEIITSEGHVFSKTTLDQLNPPQNPLTRKPFTPQQRKPAVLVDNLVNKFNELNKSNTKVSIEEKKYYLELKALLICHKTGVPLQCAVVDAQGYTYEKSAVLQDANIVITANNIVVNHLLDILQEYFLKNYEIFMMSDREKTLAGIQKYLTDTANRNVFNINSPLSFFARMFDSDRGIIRAQTYQTLFQEAGENEKKYSLLLYILLASVDGQTLKKYVCEELSIPLEVVKSQIRNRFFNAAPLEIKEKKSYFKKLNQEIIAPIVDAVNHKKSSEDIALRTAVSKINCL